jgi:hypothetical protein
MFIFEAIMGLPKRLLFCHLERSEKSQIVVI